MLNDEQSAALGLLLVDNVDGFEDDRQDYGV
jgi:hypothetical protein